MRFEVEASRNWLEKPHQADATSKIKIALLYPDLLGTYGDSGNAQILAVRARMRGVGCELTTVNGGQAIPDDADIYVLGGGEDGPQQAAVEMARRDGGIARAFERGAQILAICAGFQILGESFATAACASSAGLGLVPVVTRRGQSRRCVGELLVDPDPALAVPLVSCYENHGGQSELLEGRPLGKVLVGVGNRYHGGVDGYLSDNVVASYGHGPLLARNPALADFILARVPGAVLGPLGNQGVAEEIAAMRSERIAAARKIARAARFSSLLSRLGH